MYLFIMFFKSYDCALQIWFIPQNNIRRQDRNVDEYIISNYLLRASDFKLKTKIKIKNRVSELRNFYNMTFGIILKILKTTKYKGL